MLYQRNTWFTKYSLNILYVCVSLGWLSWFGNSLVMFVLYRQRASLQPTDFLTLNLAISDASISVFGYSRGILEIFNIFKDDGYLITWIWTCQVSHTKTVFNLEESSSKESFYCLLIILYLSFQISPQILIISQIPLTLV